MPKATATHPKGKGYETDGAALLPELRFHLFDGERHYRCQAQENGRRCRRTALMVRWDGDNRRAHLVCPECAAIERLRYAEVTEPDWQDVPAAVVFLACQSAARIARAVLNEIRAGGKPSDQCAAWRRHRAWFATHERLFNIWDGKYR